MGEKDDRVKEEVLDSAFGMGGGWEKQLRMLSTFFSKKIAVFGRERGGGRGE